MTPAGRIRHARRLLGMTQRQLAEALPTSPATIALWEQGERNPLPLVRRAVRDLARERGLDPDAAWPVDDEPVTMLRDPMVAPGGTGSPERQRRGQPGYPAEVLDAIREIETEDPDLSNRAAAARLTARFGRSFDHKAVGDRRRRIREELGRPPKPRSAPSPERRVARGAHRSGDEWSVDDDADLRLHLDAPDADLAARLGRTVAAVRSRRRDLGLGRPT